jgi:hypothetical protein
MTGVLKNNFGMWWRRRIAGPAVNLEPLARERAALERLIATTDNAAVAELAKIRLRVVRFLGSRGEPTSSSVEPTDPTAAEVAEVTVDLPRTHSPIPSAHLVDVVAKVGALERLHSANGTRYAELKHETLPPMHTRDDARPYKLTAIGFRSVSLATVFAVAVVGLALFVTAVVGPSALREVIQSPSSQSAIVVSTAILVGWYFLLLSFRAALRVPYASGFIDQCGLHLGSNFAAWDAMVEIRLTERNRQIHIEATTRDGRRIVLQLEKLLVFPLDKPRVRLNEWLSMFVSFMRSRPQHPRLIVNDALLLQEQR